MLFSFLWCSWRVSYFLPRLTKIRDFKAEKNMEIFNAIYKNLDLMYVDTLDAEVVVGNEVSMPCCVVSTLILPIILGKKMKELKNLINGWEYAGVGAVIRYNFQLPARCISGPYENIPAAEVGLKKGDIITSIDDEDMKPTGGELCQRWDFVVNRVLLSCWELSVQVQARRWRVKVTRRTIGCRSCLIMAYVGG